VIFVDTSAWYALEVEDDMHHDEARRFLSKLALGKHGVSITTDYVLDETLTLMRSRRSLSAATAFIDKVRRSKSVRIFWIDEGLFEKALDLFRDSDHKSWSFTDCTSFALMKELSVLNAFAFDSHFKEAGLQLCP
jgi:predicted nucleic acid-binding protein